jgi:hypothetical protein
MTQEQQLLEKLRLIEALFAGAATPGERDAAAHARERIRARLRGMQDTDPPIEFSFTMRNPWSHRLLTALLRRYNLRPYRYHGQRYTTVMARVPRRFVNETLRPEFLQLDKTLTAFLDEVTNRVIAEGIEGDRSEVEVRQQPQALHGGSPGAVGAELESG